jgi:hypothetical protein
MQLHSGVRRDAWIFFLDYGPANECPLLCSYIVFNKMSIEANQKARAPTRLCCNKNPAPLGAD